MCVQPRAIAFISDDLQQLFDTMASDRCDNPKLGKMGANGIDHRGLLADEQVPGTVQRQAALLPWRFGRHEPHVRSADCRKDRLGISGIVLMLLHIGLHVGQAASGARSGQGPEIRATNDATRRKLRYKPGTAAASGRKLGCSGASTGGG